MRFRKRPNGLFEPEKPGRLEPPSLIRGGAHLGPVAAGGGPAFTPADLSDLIFWMDTDDLGAADSLVSSWVAQNDAGIDFTASGSQRPTVRTTQFGGQKAIENLGNDELNETNITHSIGTGGFYIAFVMRPTALTGFPSFVVWDSSLDAGLYYNVGQTRWEFPTGTDLAYQSLTNLATNTNYVIENWRDSSDDSIRVRQNGTIDTNNRSSGVNLGTTDDFMLLDTFFGGDDLDGFLGDVIVTSSTPTATERDNTKTYLADKFGITVS